ncbi:hypothetical protein [Rossellomorea marisflavi]|uniref:hypothetical protein n=1 Tax=Rossellomorea marisflavi TaxID=189381 RepID=UPI003511DB5D
MKLTRKDWGIITLAFVFFALLVWTVYWFFYLPVREEKERLTTEISNEEKLTSVLDERLAAMEGGSLETTAALQRVVPVKPMTDQLLIDLEKAEVLSGGLITKMDFTESPMEAAGEGEAVETPAGLQKLTAVLTLEADDYFMIEGFIKELERSQRIVEIEEISLEGPEELKNVEDETQKIEYGVTFSTFFLPEAGTAEEDAKASGSPPSAHKNDPFQQFPDSTVGE